MPATHLLAQGQTSNAAIQSFIPRKNVDQFKPVASFNDPMPADVTVSQTGRIFVAFPRYGDDPVKLTMSELKNGQAIDRHKIHPIIDRRFRLEEAKAAYQAQSSPELFGKMSSL